MSNYLSDLENAMQGAPSILPGTSKTGSSIGTLTGEWVDQGLVDGPTHGIFSMGDSNEPCSAGVVVTLEEADDTNGSNSQAISGASKTVTSASMVNTNDNTSVAVSTGNRSKRYVRMKAVITVAAGGSSAGIAIPASGSVFGVKKIV